MIADFYNNADIFFTGGSGVVGKAAIEKLLRSCDVNKIYMLLRCKKGVNPEQRLEHIKKSKIFRVLKECKPKELDKLVAIPGDIELDGLGISSEHRKLLKNVSIFIHSAATTRFSEPIRNALLANLKSTLESLKLAETLENLKIFVYVSTFFSNPHVKHIQDKVYPAVFDWKTAIKMLDYTKNDEMDTIVISAITDKLKKGFPNTYLFSKHLTEQMVNDYRHKLPVTIYRPSIIVPAYEEPEPGFTESIIGFVGLLTVWGAGLMKVLRANTEVRADCSPLDISTKLLLIYTAKAGRLPREKFDEATPVSMCSSSEYFPCTFGLMGDTLDKACHAFPLEKSVLIPGMTMTNSPLVYRTINLFLEIAPAFTIDLLLRVFGQKPFMMGIQRKIFLTVDAIHFFSSNQFTSDGVTDYQQILKTEEGTDFDIRSVSRTFRNGNYDDLRHTVTLLYNGCRKFLMNEDDSNLRRARNILKAKIFVYNIIRCYLLYVIGRAIYWNATPYISG